MRFLLATCGLLACLLDFSAKLALAAAPPPKAKTPPPRPSGKCQDTSPSCKQFAALGYCTSKPVYMIGTAEAPGNCLATCKKCPAGTCKDTTSNCKQFAALGYCASRPVYMIGTDTAPGNCLASCGSCLPVPCQDTSPNCKQFAALGYCSSRPVFMIGTATAPGNCLVTCKKCPAGTCIDASPNCKQFAAMGYCTSKPVFMTGTSQAPGNCLASCKSCLPATPAPPPPSPAGALTKFFIPPATGSGTILSLARNKFCLAPSAVGGRRLVMTTCDGSAKQLWKWSAAARTLVHAASGLCITFSAKLAEGSAVNLQECVAKSRLQQWSYIPYTFAPITPLSDKAWCLNLDAVTNNAPVAMGKTPKASDGVAPATSSLFGLFAPKCADLNPQCPALAKQGRCTTDKLYMLGDSAHVGACTLSCGKCPAPSKPPPSPKPQPPTPPGGYQPPRGGGAQGFCVEQCPPNYNYDITYCVNTAGDFGCVFPSDFDAPGLCVGKPTEVYNAENCQYTINTDGPSVCDPCRDGYNQRFDRFKGTTCEKPRNPPFYYLCPEGQQAPTQPDGPATPDSPPPSPPSPPPSPPPPPSNPAPPPSPSAACGDFDWCCLFYGNQGCIWEWI